MIQCSIDYLRRVVIPLLLGMTLIACRQSGVDFFWSSTGTRMYLDSVPEVKENAISGSLWRGERGHCVAIIKSETNLTGVDVSAGDLRYGRNTIPSSNILIRFGLPVFGDSLVGPYHQCGDRDSLVIPRIKVFDILDNASGASVIDPPYRPVWLTVSVPVDAAPGTYKGTVVLRAGGKRIASLPLKIKVDPHILPPPDEWQFHLDLWQNPYAVARYHGVELWSPEHFALMDPVISILANAGQNAITTTITDRPWNGQTEDPFGSMVKKIRHSDGKWDYDYSVFDTWVEYMMRHGIDKQISCYSLITMVSSFDYYDEASSTVKFVEARPGTRKYIEFWEPFLHDFAAHLREKDWLGKTYLAMDESHREDLVAVRDFVSRVEPEFQLSLAGLYHPEVEEDLDYLSVTFHGEFPPEVVQRRRQEGKTSTIYTCCDEKYPNTFIASPPSEAAWIPLYSIANGHDGYLRWAYNSWTKDPMKDARYRMFAAGDCFLVYPEGRSSVRMEMLTAGIQLCEKTRILKEELRGESLEELNMALNGFNFADMAQNGAQAALDSLINIIDTIQ